MSSFNVSSAAELKNVLDLDMQIPNVVGFVLGLCQMVLYGYYRNQGIVIVIDDKLPQHVTNIVILPPSGGDSEVHPITIEILPHVDGGEAPRADEQQPSRPLEGAEEVVVSGDDLRAKEDMGA